MKKLSLIIGLVLISLTSNSQVSKKDSIGYQEFVSSIPTIEYQEFPDREWYEIHGDEYEGVRYYTSDDLYIIQTLTIMLLEDNILFSSPDIDTILDNGSVLKSWEYTTLDGEKIFVSYIRNTLTSDISVYIY